MSLLDTASLIVTPNAYKEGKLYSVIPSDGSGDLSVTRATTATRVNSAGLVELVPYNLITDSETYSSTWGSTFTSITKNLLSPSGITNASTIVNNVGANRSIFKAISVVSGNTYQFSFWIKKISGAFVNSTAIRLTSWGAAVSSQTYTDLGTTITTDWVRYTHTFTATSTATVYLQLISNEIHTFGLYGAQLEAGAYATSYIPTTSASVTRNVDILQRTNVYTNGWITASGGTWYGEIKNNKSLIRDASSYSFALKNASAFNSGIYLRQASGAAQRIVIAPYSTGAIPSGGAYTTSTDTVKFAAKWDGTNYNLFVNGVKVVSSIPYTQTLFEFLECPSVRDIPLFINAMALFPEALTDDQLEALTTI